MGRLQKLWKRSRTDTPEALVAELERARAQLAADIDAAMRRGRDRIVSVFRRVEALRERHGLPPSGEAEKCKADLEAGIEAVRAALTPKASQAGG